MHSNANEIPPSGTKTNEGQTVLFFMLKNSVATNVMINPISIVSVINIKKGPRLLAAIPNGKDPFKIVLPV